DALLDRPGVLLVVPRASRLDVRVPAVHWGGTHVHAAGAGGLSAANRPASGLQQCRHVELDRLSTLECAGPGSRRAADRLAAQWHAGLFSGGGDGALQLHVTVAYAMACIRACVSGH